MSLPMTCDQLDELVAELALGVLDGAARADALAHLDGCGRCRGVVEGLVGAVDNLALLAPPAEPPAGFEARVMARLAPPASDATGSGRRRRAPARRGWPPVPRLAVLAGAAVALMVAAAVGYRAAPDGHDDGPPVARGAMTTAAGAHVGAAFVHREDPAWVVVAVPGWAREGEAYHLRLGLADGERVVGEPTMPGPTSGTFVTVVPPGSAAVRTVALVGEDGRVYCEATVT
ncbi:MAG: hypothetical protein ACT4PW_05125 [Acidimicrobiia bacterium]